MIHLYPCVELYLDRPDAADWPTLPVDAPSHVRLHADMSELAIGSVMATFACYNAPENARGSHATRELLRLALEKERLILPGGILATDDAAGIEIAPGCCAGLEHWRDWRDFLRTGHSPWLGHDPSPFLAIRNDMIDIVADEVDSASAVRLSLARADFAHELVAVEDHLRSFSVRVRQWADAILPEHAATLITRWNSAFGAEPTAAE